MRDIIDILDEVKSKENKLIRVLVVFRSPVTRELDYRVAYFTEAFEASTWKINADNTYKDLKIDHSIYVDYINIDERVTK